MQVITYLLIFPTNKMCMKANFLAKSFLNLSISFNVSLDLQNMICLSVTIVTSAHSVQFPFYILLMTWHYKRLTNYRQKTHIDIIIILCKICLIMYV